MVVSNKETKRKRKDSSSIIESPEEIPKRTKIQAQRKFAQGVPVPTSSHAIGLLNNSTAGNSSTSNNDQPPTDLLPNHKPKPSDFITYLCFRNSSILPPHLDYFKQNTPPENDEVSKKTEDGKKPEDDEKKDVVESTPPAPEKRNGRGRPKKSITATVSKPSTSVSTANKESTPTPEKKVETSSAPSSPLTFAVRKRAEKVAEGTRKGRPPKTNNRKSTRKSGTNSSYVESEEEELEEEIVEKSPSPAPSVKGKRKSAPAASTSKETIVATKKPAETPPPAKKEKIAEVFTAPTPPPPPKSSTPSSVDKEKPKARRPRNRESPIFVPKPEGRMTRTRAFFEPVKVPPKLDKSEESSTEEEKTPEKNKNISDLDEMKSPEPIPEKKKPVKQAKSKQQPKKEEEVIQEKEVEEKSTKNIKPSKNESKLSKNEGSSDEKTKTLKTPTKEDKQNYQKVSKDNKKAKDDKSTSKADTESPKKSARTLLKLDDVVSKPNKTEERKASGIHVFDFSSDDEEPLASTAAAEKKKASVKKPTPVKKPLTPKSKKVEEEEKVKEKEEPQKLKPGRKRKSEALKIVEKSESSDEEDAKSTVTRKNTSRKSRGRKKSESEEETRRARPTRKTKEAANIYMELIGQKLNLENFDDDNMSMESYPELPNVKETEKMETELKSIHNEKAKRDEQEKEKEKIKEKEKEKIIEKEKIEKEKKAEKEKEKDKEKEKEKVKEKEKEPEKETPPTQGRRGRPPKKTKQAPTIESKDNDLSANKNDEEEDFLLKEELNETKRKLEKSFSDSDDEPLAVKLSTTNEKKAETTPQSIKTAKVETIPPTLTPSKLNLPSLTPPAKVTPLPSEPSTSSMQIMSPTPTNRFENKTKFSPSIVSTPSNFTPRLPQPKYHTPPTTYPPAIEAYPAPKINPNFLTPKFDRNLDRSRISSNLDSPYSSSVHKNLTFPSPSPLKIDSNSTPKSTNSPSGKTPATPAKTDPLKDEIGSILAASLLPNREETNKIFGIASVTLAQSSGPDNTKCTLGKCGQVHKPALGPVVPTESYLGEQLSSKERRKAKVNMTHEQIQKWLIECSSNPDEIDDDLDDDFSDLKPQTFSTTPPPHHRDDKESTSSSSKNTRDLGKSESVWSGKGPSLKATPVLIKDTDKRDESTDRDLEVFSNSGRASKINNQKNKREEAIKGQPAAAATDLSIKNQVQSSTSYAPPKVQKKNTIYSRNKEETKIAPKEKEVKGKEKVEVDFKDKEKEKNAKDKSVSLSLNPDESNKAVKVTLDSKEKHSPSPTVGQQKKKPTPPGGSKATDKPSEILLNAGDSDDEGHTYYIPLDASSFVPGTGLKSDMIQGVAVKLGREGPSGPNQKVIMRATLVTKSQMESNNTNSATEVNNSTEAPSKKTELQKTPAQPSTSASPPKSKPKDEATTPPPLTRVNSNSSLFSGSNKSKSALPPQPAQSTSLKKFKDDSPVKMANNTAFPRHDDPTQMVEAPIFRPTEKEFQDPMEYIERITPLAARFGICKIIPPASFKPECRVSDDMRFTAYNQYVHKMLHRWGPSAKELSAIKKYLSTQNIMMNHPPWIGGMEVDLPRLYHTVQELGGLKEVIEKKKWVLVAEKMCIPKLAQDRVTKLDDIYCKYLLPYDTLSQTERQKLFDEVEADWAKREARARRNADRFVNTESVSNEEDEVSTDDEDESEEEIDGVSMECIVKGRNMPLSQFFRIARNTMALWFQKSPTSTEIERDFWHHVAVRDSHVCVHSGSIDSSGWGYGFPTPGPKGKGSICAKHPWNLKVLTNNPGSVLRSLGPVIGVTVPTLHVGMVFSACCWYRDPHGLSWIEYLHTGASKIWYGIPDDQSVNFRQALTQLIPTHCQNKTLWLPCDTVMVPPYMLTERGVSLCRIEQKPGEFVVIFPRAYTSSIATGYVVSESVYFATSSWLDLAKDDFKDIHDSCEPAMFSLEQLLFALAGDQRIPSEIISQVIPMMGEVYDKEVAAREQLKAAGVTSTEKIMLEKSQKSKSKQIVPEEFLCETCRANLYISMVRTDENNLYCLQHALKNLNKGNIQAKQCKLIFSYNIEDIENLIKSVKDKLSQKRTLVVANSSKKFLVGSK